MELGMECGRERGQEEREVEGSGTREMVSGRVS